MLAKSVVLIDILSSGVPGREHFRIEDSTVEVPAELDAGCVLVKLLVISADPYLRGAIKGPPSGSVAAGGVMNGFVGGKVVASTNEKWSAGDLFGGALPFTTVQLLKPEALANTLMWKLTGLIEEADISRAIGILGMPGATAYGGLCDILRPNKGETVFVSAASGAVGGLVGMIAKTVYDCKVVGSCGGPAKCAVVKDKFNFDEAIDYKTATNADELGALLKTHAPDGIDMYFENVGGMHWDASLAALRPKGRIAVCGQIAEYNSVTGSASSNLTLNPMKMIYTQQRIEGFVSTRWLMDPEAKWLKEMHKWMTEGKLKVQETFFDGIDRWPDAFNALFTGANLGKVVVRVD